MQNLRNNLDALPRSCPVTVEIFLSGTEVVDRGTLHKHAEGPLAVIRSTTSPLASAVGETGITTGPDTDRKSHWGLWIVLGVVCILGKEGANFGGVDVEIQGILGPHDGVIVVVVHSTTGNLVLETVPKVGHSLAEVVAVNVLGIGA